MDATVLIPLHHTQYKAIQNIHMGRDVRTEIPEAEREAFLALNTSYEILYEYLVNKYPERFTDGAKVVFEERKSVKDQKGTGKILATVSKITTNYLGAKARVENVLPRTEEVPKPPPKPEAEPAAAGAGKPKEATEVVPLVDTETGAVAPPTEQKTVYIAVNPRWYDYSVEKVGGTVVGLRQLYRPRAEPRDQKELDDAAKNAWDLLRIWKNTIGKFQQYTLGRDMFPSVKEYPTIGKDLRSYMLEYNALAQEALFNSVIDKELFHFSEKLREHNQANYDKMRAYLDDYYSKLDKTSKITGAYYEKLKGIDYEALRFRELSEEEKAENERRAAKRTELEAQKASTFDPWVEKNRKRLLALVEKAAAEIVRKYKIVGLNDISPTGSWPIVLYKKKEDGKIYQTTTRSIVQYTNALAAGFSKERPE